MNWFAIWLFGAICFPIALGIINRYAKIVHRSDFKKDDDVPAFIVGMLFASALWPLCTAIIIIVGIGVAFRKFFIPN